MAVSNNNNNTFTFVADVMRATSAVGVVVDGTPSGPINTGSNHSSENGKLGVHVVGGIGSSNGTLGGGSAGGGTSVNGMNGGGSSGSVIGTTTTSGGDATQSESSFRLSTKSGPVTLSCGRRVSLADTEDLIHLSGPLTEDALIRCLQARCAAAKYFVSIPCKILKLTFFSSSIKWILPILMQENPFADSTFPFYFAFSITRNFLLIIRKNARLPRNSVS